MDLKSVCSKHSYLSFAFIFGAFFLLSGPVFAQEQTIGVQPDLLKDVGFDQRLNNQVPLNLEFHDERGQTVQLGQFFHGKPVILSLVYYQCPMLCTEVLDGELQTLKDVSLNAGKDFEVVTVSIDPRDRPVEGEAKRMMYTSLYGRQGSANAWHFLTGEDLNIHQLADAVGFRYAYDSQTGEYAHAAGLVVLTPDGKVSRYFYGIHFPARDVRLGLVEASADKIGTPIDDALLFCYHYDPITGKYGVVIANVLKAAGIFTILALALMIFLLIRHTPQSISGKHA